MRRWVPTNWVSGRTLQPSIESVVASSFVPSDFLVDGQVSGLGTVYPLLSLMFFCTWILHVPFSMLKRKSSSAMDGLQRRREVISYDSQQPYRSVLALCSFYLCSFPTLILCYTDNHCRNCFAVISWIVEYAIWCCAIKASLSVLPMLT